MSTTPITATLVVCVAAAGVAAGALFLEAGDDSPSPAPAAATADAAGTDPTTGGYGSSGSPPAGETAAAEPVALDISGFRFASVTVDAAGQVTVVNRDGAPHTVTADDGAFDTGRVDAGASVAFTAPSQPGTYPFHCDIHPGMTGTLTVR